MTQVQPGYLKPPTATCVAVLSIASRNGDVQLATDVFRLLTEREINFTTHHYELLIETHLKANDLAAAVSVILIMVDANLKVTAETCHPLYWYLRNEKPHSSSLPLAAFTLLQDAEAKGRKVPTAAINACIQASIALSRLEEAIEMYKALHSVSHTGPNTQTFNILFQGCSKASRKELAMFLAAEMIELKLQPDRLTYDRLIIVCMQADELDDALAYYEEMRDMGMRPRRGTYELLITQAAEKGDERCVALLREFKESGDVVTRAVERAVGERFVEQRELLKGREGERDVGGHEARVA
jgi:pentatricopeptide repeat protein